MASRKRIVLCYVLLQASFWGMISSICAYQAAIVLDRGFTTGQAGIFCALCYLASLFTQPVIGGWADRHPSVPIKQLLIVMLLPAVALNLVFYFTRPGFALTALIIFLFGVLETNSYPLIDSMGMQYVNAGVKIPYSFARGMGSLTYAVLCVVTGLPSALVFGLLQKKMSSAKILLISIIFMVVKPLLILASGSLGMLLAVQPVQMLGYGLFFPASVYFANESVDPADRVQSQSIRTILAISLSTLLGSLVSGYLIDLGGTTLMLWFSTGCAFIGVLIALGALAVQKKSLRV